MAITIDSFPDPAGGGTILRILVPFLDRSVIEQIGDAVPKAIAEIYVRNHAQEIMDRLSLNEIATQIAAQIGQRVAAAIKLPEGLDAIREEPELP